MKDFTLSVYCVLGCRGDSAAYFGWSVKSKKYKMYLQLTTLKKYIVSYIFIKKQKILGLEGMFCLMKEIEYDDQSEVVWRDTSDCKSYNKTGY